MKTDIIEEKIESINFSIKLLSDRLKEHENTNALGKEYKIELADRLEQYDAMKKALEKIFL